MRDEAGQAEEVASSMLEPKPGQRSDGHVPADPVAIASNYRYWREHGAGWAKEYDDRKREQVYYHIQEIMLTEYVRHHAPARVLEFGCGPGRHLRNLVKLPGIEVFGYDQSAAMVSGARGWTSQQWLDEHVTIGMPTGRLPFADKQFDLVYTAEVLVHVRPEDLPGILRELVRVSKRQVFHLETSPSHQLVSGEHDGCWWHDLIEAYARIGHTCEMLASGYTTHAPYRVILDTSTPVWQWSPAFLDLCRRMDRDVSHTMDIMRGSLQGEQGARAHESNARQEAERELVQARAALRHAQEQADRQETELVQVRAEAVSMHRWAQSESAARSDLGVAVRLLESRLSEAHREVAAREQEVLELEHREAELLRAVDQRVVSGADAAYESLGHGAARKAAIRRVLDRISEQTFEIALIKQSRTYKLANEVRKHPAMRMVPRLLGRGRAGTTIEVTGDRHPNSKGHEVWLLAAHMNAGEPSIPWEFIERRGACQERHDAAAPYGRCLICTGGQLSIPTGTSPELVFLSHPWSGKVRVTCGGRTEEIDLYSEHGGRVKVYPTRTPMAKGEPEPTIDDDESGEGPSIPTGPAAATMSDMQEAFVARVRGAKASVVAVHCPRWLGVTNSTKNLFEHLYPVPESPDEEPYHLTDQNLAEYAVALLECGADTIVFSGGDEAHYRLMRILHKARPSLRFLMLWHGNYVQLSDDYAFKTLRLWISAAKDGRLASIGTVKAGMESFFESLGVRSHFVMNYIKEGAPPQTAPAIAAPGVHLGLWMSGTLWKTPNVMLAAAKMIGGAKLHTAGIDARTKELIEQYQISTGFVSTKPLPFAELMSRMRQTHLTMYVTFTECCPMIPLESFSQGVPAIVGPTSHLFQDDEFLRSRLVVPFPDRADAIASTIRGVLQDRDTIVQRYAAYAPGYNVRARESVQKLLS